MAAIDFLSHFPYPQTRLLQEKMLTVLGKHWDDYDVMVIGMPTASGKTAVARTLMSSLQSVSVITPTNQLVTQFTSEFPETCTLSRLDSYRCAEWQRPCSVTRGKLRNFCKGCPAGKALATAKYRKGPGVYNYHIYLAHKLHRKALVVDEAHNLIPFIRERFSVTLWKHDFRFPDRCHTVDMMRAWVQSLPQSKVSKSSKLSALENAVVSRRPQWIPHRTRKEFSGKGTIRGQPEMRDCIELLPVDISECPPLFWPGLGREGGDVQKLVLLSATISRKDVEALGLNRKRVLYINCESPIPAASRPIVQIPVATVNHRNLAESTAAMVDLLRREILPTHAGQKGLIHATYQQAAAMRSLCADEPRYLFHTAIDKSDVYNRFRSFPPESGAVLVASGMYEGIDLPLDAARWQAIAKVPWPNLGSPHIRYLADSDPEWYLWECLKITMQACGRICRTPEDFGVTLILDSSFERLIRESNNVGLVPDWFLDGIEEGSKLV